MAKARMHSIDKPSAANKWAQHAGKMLNALRACKSMQGT